MSPRKAPWKSQSCDVFPWRLCSTRKCKHSPNFCPKANGIMRTHEKTLKLMLKSEF